MRFFDAEVGPKAGAQQICFATSVSTPPAVRLARPKTNCEFRCLLAIKAGAKGIPVGRL